MVKMPSKMTDRKSADDDVVFTEQIFLCTKKVKDDAREAKKIMMAGFG
jgi:hypothetical protein